MSIFKRDCPECAAANPPEALVCACGYCFDPDTLAHTDPEAYARQQERLYLEYLEARLEQARYDASAARDAARAEPGDRTRAVAARAAEAALAALRTELAEHSQRVPAAHRTKPVARPAQPAARRPHANAQPVARESASAKPAATERESLPSVLTSRPSASFRRAQAEKAKAIVHSSGAARGPRRTAPATPRAPAMASASAAGHRAAKTCPNCTAIVPADTERCRCGYAFARPGEAVPALSLDAGALAILADGITFTGPDRGR